MTDHHLPALGETARQRPEADVIVNPNQPGCGFASKALAGVGVMFYMLLALRRRAADGVAPRRNPGWMACSTRGGPGTVADVGVKLDANNRRPWRAGPQAHSKRPRPTGDPGGTVRRWGAMPARPRALTSVLRSAASTLLADWPT